MAVLVLESIPCLRTLMTSGTPGLHALNNIMITRETLAKMCIEWRISSNHTTPQDKDPTNQEKESSQTNLA